MKAKNTRFKKTLFAIFVCISLILLLSVNVFAIDSAPVGAESITDGVTEGTKDMTAEEESEAEPSEADNVFAAFFQQVKNYATEIFCALTFVGSLILSYAYKRGLVPIIQGTLENIGAAVGKIKDATEVGGENSKEFERRIGAVLETVENTTKSLSEKLDGINDEILALENSEDERMKMKVIIQGQIDMLYDVFMSSALPQYKKDEIGERVAKMREALKGECE